MRTISFSLATLLFVAFGCTQRQVKIEMEAGIDGARRAFESNLATKVEIAHLSDTYDTDPSRRADKKTGVRFEGQFEAGQLPSEVGNRNGLSSLSSKFGTTWYYFEQFGEPANDWEVLKRRMNAGELWLRLGARYVELQLKSDEDRAEWRAFAEEHLVPDALSAFLRFNAGQFAITGQRVSARVRGQDDHGPRTFDETFQVNVFAPLTAFAVDRGWVEPSEAQILGLIGIDGWVSRGEREWSQDAVLEPILRRIVNRFLPEFELGDRLEEAGEKLTWLGLAFLWWVNTSSDSIEVMLASDAISPRDKAKLRTGNRAISMPGPFGFSIRGGAKPLVAELDLTTPSEPFLTNGDWDESLSKIQFRTKVFSAADRRRLAPPVFHAAWSVPDSEAQENAFERVVLEGQALAEYCIWEQTLSDEDAELWTTALESGSKESMLAALREIDGDSKHDRPPPTSLLEACQP